MDATEDQLITEEDSGHPLKALPEQEIHKAVFDCKPDKIPGPDGFQRNLFQSGTSSKELIHVQKVRKRAWICQFYFPNLNSHLWLIER